MIVATLLLMTWLAAAADPNIGIAVGATAPTNAQNGDLWSDTTANALKRWDGASWATISGGAGESVPAGSILLIKSGTCPTGYAEESDLDGKTLVGTLAAHANVGTTGGTDSITPSGSNSAHAFTGTAWSAPAISWPAGVPTFTGDAITSVINHTHTVTVTDPGHTHVETNNSATTGGLVGFAARDTSTNTQTATGYSTESATTGITATTVNPAGGVASITPSGAIGLAGWRADNWRLCAGWQRHGADVHGHAVRQPASVHEGHLLQKDLT